MKISRPKATARNLNTLRSATEAAARAGFHAWKSSSNFGGVARESSFPFISSDTFRSAADIVIANEFSPEDLDGIRSLNKNAMAMVELSFIKNKGGGDPLLRWASDYNSLSNHRLGIVLHNGDWVPSGHYLQSLAETGADVYCVNVLDGLPGVTPIPVGLENSIRRKNGVLHDFLFVHDQRREPWASLPSKSRQIFGSFKVSTNFLAREPLAQKMLQTRHGFIEKRMSIKNFRDGILKSKFVVSPPGNGPDCYRTWEAIYLGAVPIVLQTSLAESLHSDLPIWAVNDWDEALSASDDELNQKYEELIQRTRDKAYFPYWLRKISEQR